MKKISTAMMLGLLLVMQFTLPSCASHQSDLPPLKEFVLKPDANYAVVRFTREHQRGNHSGTDAKLMVNNHQVATLTDNSDYEQFIVSGDTMIFVSDGISSDHSAITLDAKPNTI